MQYLTPESRLLNRYTGFALAERRRALNAKLKVGAESIVNERRRDVDMESKEIIEHNK